MCYEKYIFLDESGDPGENRLSSKFFVITLLITSDKNVIEHKLKKYKLKLMKKKKYKLKNEIKAYNSQKKVRFDILNIIKESNIEIYTIILNKSNFYNRRYDKKIKIYDYLVSLILAECNLTGKFVHLIIDKRVKNKIIRDEFDNYIKVYNNKINLTISHLDSYSSNGLQLVDFISWSIFRNYEFNDNVYLSYLKEKITLKKELYFDK